MPIVFLMRSFQCLKVDLDIHQGSIRRNETTTSTKVMMDDDDVSIWFNFSVNSIGNPFVSNVNNCFVIIKLTVL